MQSESENSTIEAMKKLFEKKYNEEISSEMLAQLSLQYSVERVQEVITKMKPDAYNPVNFLKRSLSSGWYKSEGNKKPNWTERKRSKGEEMDVEKTTMWSWNLRYEIKWIEKDERDYMIDVLLHGAQPDEQKVQDIWFKVYQSQYPRNPQVWFFWLKWPENQQAANEWIERVGRSDLPLYDIPKREATLDELL